MSVMTCRSGSSYRASHLRVCMLAALPMGHECCRRPLTLVRIWSPSTVTPPHVTGSPNVMWTRLVKLAKRRLALIDHGVTTGAKPPQLQPSKPPVTVLQLLPSQPLHVPLTQLLPGHKSNLLSKKSSLVVMMMMMSLLLPRTWWHTRNQVMRQIFERRYWNWGQCLCHFSPGSSGHSCTEHSQT